MHLISKDRSQQLLKFANISPFQFPAGVLNHLLAGIVSRKYRARNILKVHRGQ
jgi:hypothetical protein